MILLQSLTTACLLSVATALTTEADWFYWKTRPFVLGHRGAYGHFPESSLGGFTDAWFMGADWIEFDVNMTRDGHLVIQHDSCLKSTTNARVTWDHVPEMAARKSNYKIIPSGDWCKDDYSIPTLDLAEIKQLRRRQQDRSRSKVFNDMFEVMTLDEGVQFMFDMKENYEREFGQLQWPGLYIEVKDPIWYEEEYQMDLTTAVFEVLQKFGIETIEKATAAGVPIIFQSFEIEALIVFKELSDLPLNFMMDWQVKNGQDYSNFTAISEVCHGVGPQLGWLFNEPYESFFLAENHLTGKSAYIEEMHDLGLQVHPWTFRFDKPYFYPKSGYDETMLYLIKGVDGIFTEQVQSTRLIFEGATFESMSEPEFLDF